MIRQTQPVSILIVLTALLAVPSTLQAGWTFELPGDGYVAASGLVTKLDDGVALLGGAAGAWVSYEITIPQWAVSFSLSMDWWLVRPGDGVTVYVYDNAATGPDRVYGRPELDHRWRLWQSSRDLGRFTSSNPRFLLTRGDNPRGLVPVDRNWVLRLLVYVDGGIPLLTDELAVIQSLRLTYSDRDELWLPDSPQWRDLLIDPRAPGFDLESGLLVVEGLGRASATQRDTARGRLLAERAALVNALANAVVTINEQVAIQLIPGDLPGYRILESEEREDGYWRVRLGIPLNGPGALAEHMGYHRILSK